MEESEPCFIFPDTRESKLYRKFLHRWAELYCTVLYCTVLYRKFLHRWAERYPRAEEGGEEEQASEAEDVASAVQEPVYEEVKLTAKVFDYKSKQFKKTDSQ